MLSEKEEKKIGKVLYFISKKHKIIFRGDRIELHEKDLFDLILKDTD